MLPEIWIFDTYTIMLLIGVVCCLLVFHKFAKSRNRSKDYIYSIEILGCISILVGLLGAVGFQSLFDALEGNNETPLNMTFYGGLVFGALTFIVGHKVYISKKFKEVPFSEMVKIAPSCITIAHGFGRIGCFLAGCCYGIETDSFLGVTFPGHSSAVYPTQLFEAVFLFALFAILFYLALKKDCKYTMPIYLASYGLFRFLIEFIRGDDRGAYFLALSPAQWFSIVAIILAVVLFIFIKKQNKVIKN